MVNGALLSTIFNLDFALLRKDCCGIGLHKPIMGSQKEETKEAKEPICCQLFFFFSDATFFLLPKGFYLRQSLLQKTQL